MSESDDSPTNWQRSLRTLLLRAFNENQLLILSEIKDNSDETISSLLRHVSESTGIALSTLKYNAKILRSLNLVSYGNFQTAKLTDFGRFIVHLIGVTKDEN